MFSHDLTLSAAATDISSILCWPQSRRCRTMTLLIIIAVLATFPSVLATSNISTTSTHYVNFTCMPPHYLGMKNLYSLKLVYTTKSHFRRSLLEVPREEYHNILVGDVPPLFRCKGKINESDAASSFLMASFPLTEDLYGNYSCVTSYEPSDGKGTKEQWTHLQIDAQFGKPVNSEPESFRANVRPAYQVKAEWRLREMERKSTVTISRYMQNNTIYTQELVICKLEKDQPHCFTFPVVADYKLSFSDVVTLDFIIIEDEPSPYMNYVINISEYTLRSFSREPSTLPTNSIEPSFQDCDCTVFKITMSVVIVVLFLVILFLVILLVFRKNIFCRQCRRNRRDYIMNNRNGDERSPININQESNDDQHGESGVQTSLLSEPSRSSLLGQQEDSLSVGDQQNSSSPGRDQRGSGAQQNSSPTGDQIDPGVQQNLSSPADDQRGSGAQQNSSPTGDQIDPGVQQNLSSPADDQRGSGAQQNSSPTGGQIGPEVQQNLSSPADDQRGSADEQNSSPTRGQIGSEVQQNLSSPAGDQRGSGAHQTDLGLTLVQEDILQVSEQPALGDVDINAVRK